MGVDAIALVTSTRRRGTRHQSADVSLHEVDDDNAEDIRPILQNGINAFPVDEAQLTSLRWQLYLLPASPGLLRWVFVCLKIVLLHPDLLAFLRCRMRIETSSS